MTNPNHEALPVDRDDFLRRLAETPVTSGYVEVQPLIRQACRLDERAKTVIQTGKMAEILLGLKALFGCASEAEMQQAVAVSLPVAATGTDSPAESVAAEAPVATGYAAFLSRLWNPDPDRISIDDAMNLAVTALDLSPKTYATVSACGDGATGKDLLLALRALFPVGSAPAPVSASDEVRLPQTDRERFLADLAAIDPEAFDPAALQRILLAALKYDDEVTVIIGAGGSQATPKDMLISLQKLFRCRRSSAPAAVAADAAPDPETPSQ
jgi:hypothetical protein